MAVQNILINFGRRHHEEHFFEIILNLDQLFRRRGHLKIFFISNSFGGLFVQCFQTNYGSRPYTAHFCETVLNLEQWLRGNAA